MSGFSFDFGHGAATDRGSEWRARQRDRIERHLRQRGGWVTLDELVDVLLLSRNEVVRCVLDLEKSGTIAVDAQRPLLPMEEAPFPCPQDAWVRQHVRGPCVAIRPKASRGGEVARPDDDGTGGLSIAGEP